MADVNSEQPATPQTPAQEPVAAQSPVEPEADGLTPLDPMLAGAVATTTPSQDVPPGETPIYMGVNGMPARPPVGPQFVCPYCGGRTSAMARCDQCRGPLDPLSRQATQNTMGPWFIRDEGHPFRPGCNYGTLAQLVQRGKVTMDTVLRGPTTRQFWTPLRRVPGVSHLLGVCHSCQTPTPTDAMGCGRCGASFVVDEDRQNLGLGPVHLLPGQAPADRIASSTLTPSATAPMVQAVHVPPIVSAAGSLAANASRDRVRLDRMEREARALKLSLSIAAIIVVVLLAAFMLAILDARLGLGLGIADSRAAAHRAGTSDSAVTLPTPSEDVSATPPSRSSSDLQVPANKPDAPSRPTVAAQPDPAQAAMDQAVAKLAADTPDAIAEAIGLLEGAKTSDPDLAKRIGDALTAAKARLEQLRVRKGL